jgi:O-acetyl-ADP-ribose deacetylase (regulator of RNase III)
MDADFKGIEKGLVWLRDKYTREGIKSLALPALGCGLGNLKWQDVGPLMCRMLSDLDIPVKIYLPAEKRVPDAQLAPEVLLKKMPIQTTI